MYKSSCGMFIVITIGAWPMPTLSQPWVKRVTVLAPALLASIVSILACPGCGGPWRGCSRENVGCGASGFSAHSIPNSRRMLVYAMFEYVGL